MMEEVVRKDLYIIGAGGFGREVAWLVERINEIRPTWKLKGFIDDNSSLWGAYEGEYPIIGGCEQLLSEAESKDIFAVCAVGSARVRKVIIEKLAGKVQFATVIDPSVIISKRVEIGAGCIICAGTIITVDIKIGNHVIINLDCTLGHDDIIHDFVTIYPSVNVSGNVEIGECSEIGTGMQVIQGKKIGTGSIVGAGAVVVKDIPDRCVAVGSPAKPIKYIE
ncbi:acetyltransferase [Roseburia hominis]